MVQLEASGLGIVVREVLRAPAALEVLIMDFLVQLVWAVPTPVLIYVPEVAAVAPAGSVAVLVVMTLSLIHISWKTDRQIGVSTYAGVVVYLSNQCGLESYITTVYGNAIVVDGRTNYMPCVYIDDVLYLTGIENIEHGDNFDDYVLMPNGKYGVSVTEDPREAYRLEQEQVKHPAEPSKFHTTIDLNKGISVIYDSDGTFIDLVLSGKSTDGNGIDKYYICENATLRAVSLNKLLELGYDEMCIRDRN